MRLSILASVALVAAACAAPPSHAQSRDPMQMLRNADSNGDGDVTRAEFRSAREGVFSRLDRNSDGQLSSADASGGRRGAGRLADMMQQMTAAFDDNDDGRVSREEFVEGPARLFDHGDLNADDRLDPSEMRALSERADRQRSSQ